MKLFLVACLFCFAIADLVIYDGSTGQLQNGFQSWSWATIDLQSTTVVPPGDTYSVSVVCDNYEAFYVHGTNFVSTDYSSLNFLVNGGTSGAEPISVQVISGTDVVGNTISISSIVGTIPANKWVQVSIPLSSFGVPATTALDGIWWISESPDNVGTAYLDSISLVSGAPPPVTPVNIVVNVNLNRVPLSNQIFGVNWANSSQLALNKYTVNRWGGEGVTRYAYDVDAANHASDWYFEDLPNSDANPANLPFNSSCDAFVQTTYQADATPIITTPLIGWTPIDRKVRCGFSVAKYGAQQSTDPYQPDCGNGVSTNGKDITGNNPLDTSRAIDASFVLAWLSHLDQVFGKGKVNYFELDNEPGLWNTIQRDVHPNPLTYNELWNRTLEYAAPIKKAYPNSKIFGPIPWGWCEYMYSPADGCTDGPDRQAHEDLPLLEWYIQQVGLYKQKYGVQLVDVIDIHVYPQETNVNSNVEDPATAALRFRSTRVFWDPTYVDESWINAPIYILPRVQGWIDKYAPGLQLAVSEYQWGGDNIITGALAQVMILGIFAQYNVLLGTRWVAPALDTRTEEGFRIFTNYDGKGSSVKGDSVNTTSTNIVEAEAYAFDNKGQLYVVIVNKLDSALNVSVDVSSSTKSGSASLFSFSESKSLSSFGSAQVNAGSFTIQMNPWSAVLAVITSS